MKQWRYSFKKFLMAKICKKGEHLPNLPSGRWNIFSHLVLEFMLETQHFVPTGYSDPA